MKRFTRAAALSACFFFLLVIMPVPGTNRTALDSIIAWSKAQYAKKLYHDAWVITKDRFLHRDRMSDWDSWEHRFDKQIETEADAVVHIHEMLDSLHEGYTHYLTPTVSEQRAEGAANPNVASFKMLEGNIGYIAIRGFCDLTAKETEESLRSLKDADAYVVDLRNNLGGWLGQGFEVFSLFTDEGKYTVLKGYADGKPLTEEMILRADHLENNVNGSIGTSARRPNLAGKKPVIVLVNHNSASSSEMLAGAFRDNGRATTLGTKTYGKGIAQVYIGLLNGGTVSVTYAQFYFPNGDFIHERGLTPDKTVEPSPAGDDNQLAEGIKVLQAQLKK